MLFDHRRMLRSLVTGAIIVGLALGSCRGLTAKDDLKDGPAQPDQPLADLASTQEEEDYYALLKLFVDTLDQVERNYVKDTSRRDLLEAAIKGMLSKLDQYSNYIPPEDIDRFRRGVENQFSGVGIRLGVQNGRLTIISPFAGAPAHQAGAMAGDQIVRIEGKSTKGMTIDDAQKLLLGEAGTTVKFTVLHPHNDKTEVLSVKREVVQVRTVMGYERVLNGRWDYLQDDNLGIGYVRISVFGRRTAGELRAVLEELKKKNLGGLILDLRFNPGGLLAAAIEVSDLFITSGRIVSTKGRNTPLQAWDAHETGSFVGFPMVVLVNRYSASASEIVAACLQDHQRAVIAGERTWGKASVQNIIELEGGKSALKLTTAGYMRPSGKNIDRHIDEADSTANADEWGVRPNEGLEVKLDNGQQSQLSDNLRKREVLRKSGASAGQEQNSEEASFEDEQLRRAIAHLHSELAIRQNAVASKDADAKTAEGPKPAEPPAANDAAGDDGDPADIAPPSTADIPQ